MNKMQYKPGHTAPAGRFGNVSRADDFSFELTDGNGSASSLPAAAKAAIDSAVHTLLDQLERIDVVTPDTKSPYNNPYLKGFLKLEADDRERWAREKIARDEFYQSRIRH